MPRRAHVSLALSCLLALGCTPAGGGGVPTAPGGGAVKAGGGPAAPRPGATPGSGPGIVPGLPAPLAPGVGLISNQGAQFVGKVRAPAGIVSNNGGGIISDNGGGVVANNGGRYALRAVDQVPVAGVRVRVTDAAGAAVVGPDGQALEAVTDAQGAYAFPGLQPGRNLLVTAALPAGNGQVQAVALRGQDGPVDLDLVSTLTTAYIHASWVATQADPNATFERLTADAERQTRMVAEAAIARAGSLALATLAAADVRTAVDALRKGDATLDAQLEVVRQLLLVAGQADLGAGRDAKTVVLGFIEDVLPLPDGTLAIAARDDNRVWRVDASGRLQVLIGSGRAVEADRGGLPAADFGLNGPRSLGLDGQGRLVVADYDRLVRVEADGKVSVGMLGRGTWARAVLPGRAGDEVLVVTDGHQLVPHAGAALAEAPPIRGAAVPPELAARAAAQEAEDDDGEDDEDLDWREFEPAAGRAPDGRLHFLQWDKQEDESEAKPWAYTFDPATGRHGQAAAVDGRRVGVAPDATWFSVAADGALVATPAGGAAVRYPAAQLAKLPPALQAVYMPDEDYPPDGTLRYAGAGRTLVYDHQLVWELTADGGARHLAGVAAEADRSGNAVDVDLTDPNGLAVGADGSLYILDAGSRRVLRRDPAGQVKVFSGYADPDGFFTSEEADGGVTATRLADRSEFDFGAAYTAAPKDAWFQTPGALRPDGPGLLLVDNARFLRRLAADGTLSTLHVGPRNQSIIDVLPAAGGGQWLLRGHDRLNRQEKILDLVRRHADGRLEDVKRFPSNYGNLAQAPDGTLWLRLGQELGTWDGAAFKALARDARLDVGPGYEAQPTRLVVDAQGTAFFADDANVLRWSAAAGWTILAGPGGKHFAGRGAADGLSQPAALALDAQGGLLIADEEYGTVRRLAPEQLK